MGQEITRLAIPSGEDPDRFRKIVGAAYTAWIGNGQRAIPEVTDVCEYAKPISRNVVSRILDTEEFKQAIRLRGVPWEDGGGLSAKQMLALSVMTDPTDKRPPAAKLKAIGVTYAIYRAWLKNPLFANKLKSIAGQMIQDHIPDMEVALTNRAVNGDLNAIKFAFELTGKYDPNSKEVIQLRAVVQMLLEILSVHLSTQPQLLQAVALDIQNKMPQALTGEVIK